MQRIRRIILLFLVVFLLSSLTRSLGEYQNNQLFYQKSRAEFEKEQNLNKELQTKLIKSKDIHQFEKIVRDKLDLHKKDEYVLIIPNPTPTVNIPTPTPLPPVSQWVEILL